MYNLKQPVQSEPRASERMANKRSKHSVGSGKQQARKALGQIDTDLIPGMKQTEVSGGEAVGSYRTAMNNYRDSMADAITKSSKAKKEAKASEPYSDITPDYGEDSAAERPPSAPELMGLVTTHEAPDFDTIFSGSKIQPDKPITQMTVAEVRKFQDEMVDAGSDSSAVGKMQIIRNTLDEVIKKGVISKDDVFNEETQTKAFDYLLKKRGVDKFIEVKNSSASYAEKEQAAIEFQMRLAQEFASIPIPYDLPDRGLKKGDSYYKGTGTNQSRFGADEFTELLMMQEL